MTDENKLTWECPFCNKVSAFFYDEKGDYPNKVSAIAEFKCHFCQYNIKFGNVYQEVKKE